MTAETAAREGPEEPDGDRRKRGSVASRTIHGLAVAACVCLLFVSAGATGGLSFLIAWLGWGGLANSIGAAVAGFLGVVVATPAGIALYVLFVPDPDDDRSLLRTFAALCMSVLGMLIESALVMGAAVIGGVIGVMLFRWMSPGWAAMNLAFVAPLVGMVTGILAASPPGDSSD